MDERFAHIQSTKDGFIECNAGIIDMLKYYHGEHLQMCLTDKKIIVSASTYHSSDKLASAHRILYMTKRLF